MKNDCLEKITTAFTFHKVEKDIMLIMGKGMMKFLNAIMSCSSVVPEWLQALTIAPQAPVWSCLQIHTKLYASSFPSPDMQVLIYSWAVNGSCIGCWSHHSFVCCQLQNLICLNNMLVLWVVSTVDSGSCKLMTHKLDSPLMLMDFKSGVTAIKTLIV